MSNLIIPKNYSSPLSPDCAGFEVRQRQRQKMFEQLGSQDDVHPVCRVGEQVGAGHTQDHLEDVDEKQPQHEHVQGGKPLVDQDLVDDHLREERRD